jgi:hypothetical protein
MIWHHRRTSVKPRWTTLGELGSMKTVGLAKVDWIRLLHTTQRIHFTHSLLSALEKLAPEKGREYDERGLH